MIYAGIGDFGIHLITIQPEKKLLNAMYEKKTHRTDIHGVPSPTAALAGVLLAVEVIKQILSLPNPLNNLLLAIDWLYYDAQQIPL